MIKIDKIKEAKISFFDNPITTVIPSTFLRILEIFSFIIDSLQLITQKYREIIDPKQKADFKRKHFPFVTFSGLFKMRTDAGLIIHSWLICLDLDDLKPEIFELIWSYVTSELESTILAFRSPSGKGLKIIYAIDPNKYSQKVWYTGLTQRLADKCGFPISNIDSSCSNVSRACFLCYDPNAYINRKLLTQSLNEGISLVDISEYLKTDNMLPSSNISYPAHSNFDSFQYAKLDSVDKNAEQNIKYLIHLNTKKNGAYTSPREPWIQKLCCYCNKWGMAMEYTQKYILKYFNSHPESLNPSKPIDVNICLINPVHDTYNRYRHEFNSWESFTDITPIETPTICEEVYNTLPPALSNLFEHFNDRRERDLILLSALVVLSTCFPYFRGRYDGREVYTNLFLFISAPASAGKGVLYYSKILGQAIHERFLLMFANEMIEYEQAIATHKAEPNSGLPAPVKPKLKKFYIPGNTSASKIVETLSTNKEFGIIFETEADTITAALKNEWGNFSDVLRKAFHHEPVELQRKGNDEYLHVKTSCLSMVLSGTPNQVKSLLNNIENGLFSRFLIYDFSLTPNWKNVFEHSNYSLDFDFFNLGSKLNAFNLYTSKLTEHCRNILKPSINIIQLTESQEIRFSKYFEEKQGELYKIYGDDIVASVRRLGIIAFRIAMILTITRIIDTKEKALYDLQCCDEDIDNSLSIINTLLVHTIKIYTQLKERGRSKAKPNKQLFFQHLPDTFDRKKAMTVASYLCIKEKTAESQLTQLIQEGVVERLEHNSYRKV